MVNRLVNDLYGIRNKINHYFNNEFQQFSKNKKFTMAPNTFIGTESEIHAQLCRVLEAAVFRSGGHFLSPGDSLTRMSRGLYVFAVILNPGPQRKLKYTGWTDLIHFSSTSQPKVGTKVSCISGGSYYITDYRGFIFIFQHVLNLLEVLQDSV